MAVYVSRRDGLTGVAPDAWKRLRVAAEEMGGASRPSSQDSADGLLDVARGVNASQVLIGASRRGRLSTVLQPGVGEEVIARSGEIDVHVVTHDYARRAGGRAGPGADAEPGPARHRLPGGGARHGTAGAGLA